jgi:hypothetical protein
MLKFKLATIAVFVAVFGLVTMSAASAQYGMCAVTLDVELDEDGTASGEAESDVDCDDWNVFNDENGQTASGSGSSIDFEFDFDDLEDGDEVTITAECDAGQTECSASETVEFEDEGDDDGDGDGDEDEDGDDQNGGLPDTGGPVLQVIGSGLTLMLLGIGAVVLARRSREDTA